MLFIIVSLTYIFLLQTHTHSYLLPQLCARFISDWPIQTSAVSRLYGFSTNAALMNTTYLLLVEYVEYIIPLMDVKISPESKGPQTSVLTEEKCRI